MVIPAFLFMWLAKRKLNARPLIAGSLALAVLIAWLRS
jgi:hypothetical protein